MDDLYRDYILEHYRRPHNFGVIDAPTASFEGSNPLCGDRLTLQIGINDGVVERVGFTGRGCAISQASASLLTDEIKGKPVAEVAPFRATRRQPVVIGASLNPCHEPTPTSSARRVPRSARSPHGVSTPCPRARP